jgi:integrase/recombinase XerC
MSANVFKVGGVWHYRFQVAGCRVQKSTRLRNRARAEQLAQQAYDAAVLRANGGEPVPTLGELGAAWLVVNRPVISGAHYRSVETFLRLHGYQLGVKRVDEITTEDVELARNEHLQTHRASSANHWLRVLKLLSMWAVKRGMMIKLPWRVALIKVQQRPRAMLPAAAAKAWFESIDVVTRREPGAATAIRLMFGMGLRAGESASARWEWLDWERRTYTPGKTKGREAKPIPIADWLVDHLAPLRKSEGLIACKRDGRAFPDGFARLPIQSANKACEVKGVTPHRLRGTFATMLSEAGVPMKTVQEVMRHKHLSTTMGYIETDLDTAAIAQNRIGSRTGLSRREDGAEQNVPLGNTGNS